jgi:hypothetical protein
MKPVFGEPTRVFETMRCKQQQKLRLNYAYAEATKQTQLSEQKG